MRLRTRPADLAIALSLGFLLSESSFGGQAAVSPGVDSLLQVILEGAYQRYGVVGATMAVTLSEYGTWKGAAGFADNNGGTPLQPDELLCIGSVTKTFVAAAAIKLVEDGVLGLDDPLARWLPGMVPDGDKITVRHLLHHTSGLHDVTESSSLLEQIAADSGRVWRPEEVVALSVTYPLDFEPGSRYSYSDVGYIVAGLVVEKATGMPLARHIRRQFLEPLGLTRTYYAAGEPVPGPVGLGHDSGLKPVTLSTARLSSYGSAGAVVSTAEDLARWAGALYGGRVLKPESLDAMLSDLANVGGSYGYYGLGIWVVTGSMGRMVGHYGMVPGEVAALFHSRARGLSIAVLANTDIGLTLVEMRDYIEREMRRSTEITSRLVRHYPARDFAASGEELAALFAEAKNGAQAPRTDPTAPAYAGRPVVACEVSPTSIAGWSVTFRLPAPVDPFEYPTLRIALHPGSATGKSLGVQFGKTSGALLGTRRVEGTNLDLAVQQWQVLDIPLGAVGVSDSLAAIALTGALTGTFYLGEIRLVAVHEPPRPTVVMEERGDALPQRVGLAQNYPNPFNSETVIRFELPAPGPVTMAVYNLAGQQVAALTQGLREAGSYTVHWDGRDDHGHELASGVYLYRLRAGDREESRKLALVR